MDFNFLLTYILVIIALFYSKKEKLDLEKEIFIASIRAFIQLLILGYALIYIFEFSNPLYLILVLTFMLTFASFTAQKRLKLRYGFLIAFLTLGISTTIIIGVLLIIGVIGVNANEFIPLGGMVIGNGLNTYTLAINRFKAEIKANISIIEGKVALGAELREALHEEIKHSIKASLIPIVNNLQTVGFVFIPGITVGMLLAGAEPLKAVSYQLVIMYMIVGVALFSAIFGTLFSYRIIMWKS